MAKELRKCRCCKGKGKVSGGNVTSDCYYCRGKGVRYNNYERDRN